MASSLVVMAMAVGIALVSFVPSVHATSVSDMALPAFPGAEGFGARATGGRGGRVIKVTNLRSQGAGSFQAALDVREPRIIVFDVSGVIDGDQFIRHGNVTIAGQTAPGGGITIRGRLYAEYRYGIDNLIIRHLRVRPRPFSRAEGTPSQYDAIQLSRCRNLILDHVSAAFGVDETIDLYEARDVTVQWSTIEQSSTYDNHNYGLLNGPAGGRISVHHNLFAHHLNRNPAIANGPAEIINNVVYNVRHGFVHHNPASGRFNIIGNYYKQGPNNQLIPFYFDDENGGADKTLRYHLRDNYIDDPGDFVGAVENPWSQPARHPSFRDLALPATYWSQAPSRFDQDSRSHVPVTIEDAQRALHSVLQKAGAWPRDGVTRLSVQETRDRTGSWGARTPRDLMDGLAPLAAPVDTDGDGMPDTWEQAHGLDPRNNDDHSRILPSGYTAIEEYLNNLAEGLVRR